LVATVACVAGYAIAFAFMAMAIAQNMQMDVANAA
jgi:multidrug transporter EmrE-like cation transporter